MPFYSSFGPRAFHYSHRWGKRSRCYCESCCRRRAAYRPTKLGQVPALGATLTAVFMLLIGLAALWILIAVIG